MKPNEEKNTNKLQNVVIALSIIIAILVIVIGTIIISSGNKDNNDKGGNSTVNSSVNKEEVKYTEVKTKYCTMKYPSEWKEYITVTKSEENGVLSEKFTCDVANQTIDMFTVHFGTTDSGDVMGSFFEDGKQIPVSIEYGNFEENDTFTDEEIDTVYAILECINDVIDSISKSEGFSNIK